MSSSQQKPSIFGSPKDDKDSQTQDVDMEAPESPPEISHAASSSQASAPSGTQANTSSGRVNGEGGSGNSKANFGAPGSSWSTKKFTEEYDKAELNMLDRSWENKFGDPLADYNNPAQ